VKTFRGYNTDWEDDEEQWERRMSLPIRWRLTLFNALVIGAILLALGLSLYLLLREALLSNVENTALAVALSRPPRR
jgi:hypothetical protein